ncbi:Lar family restriction alleviation protein [Sphingomonas sp. MMS24-JH45]
MTEKLEPCPFCGGEARCDIGKNAFEDVEVSCLSGGTQGPNYDDGFGRVDNQRLAITAWNTRPSDGEREALIEALEALLLATLTCRARR